MESLVLTAVALTRDQSRMAPLHMLLVAVALASQVSAVPLKNCTKSVSGPEFIADDVDLCVYYECKDASPTIHWPARCAKGSRLASYYNHSDTNPCTQTVSNSKCLRCDIVDQVYTDDTVVDYCGLWKPCDAGCKCNNQVEGFWCDCSAPVAVTPQPPTPPVPVCKNPSYCLNGGTCHQLYDSDPFCNCVPGWTGKRCESKLCDWNPCLNNGTCVVNGTQIYCQCANCWKGSCCEIRRTEDPDCIGCSPCAGGFNCTGIRTWLCECNPCPSNKICSRAALNQVRECNDGAATAGSKFTLLFEENNANGGNLSLSALELYITAGSQDGRSRSVRVTTPRSKTASCSLDTSLVIQAGEISKTNVPIGCRHDGTGLQNFGVVVQEVNNDTLTVYGINRASFSADSFLALPDRRAGTHFVVICYPTFNNQNGTDHQSQLGIVAVEDNTQVNITLSTPTDIPGSTNDTTYIVRLNAAQTYQIQASQYGADLSGSIIVSSKPIHVTSGNIRTSVIINRPPKGTLSTDHLVEEVPPADTWGVTFAIVPIPRSALGYSRTLELIRIVASFDTNCTLYNSAGQKQIFISTFSDWFKQEILDASDNYFLECNQPVMIMEITESADESFANKQNDPSMLYVPAVSQYTNYYVFAPATYSQGEGNPYNSTLVVLAAKPSDYQQIQVNGVFTAGLPQFKPWRPIAVPAALANDTDRPQLYGGIFNIDNKRSSTIRHISKQVAFMCLIYCYDDRESIGHVAGSSLSVTNDLVSGVGLSQWQYVRTLSVNYLN